jgi:hypothetical protein
VPVAQSLLELAATDTCVSLWDYMCSARQNNLVIIWGQSVAELVAQATEVEEKLVASVSRSTYISACRATKPQQI